MECKWYWMWESTVCSTVSLLRPKVQRKVQIDTNEELNMCFFIGTKSELTCTLTNYCGNDVSLALQAKIYFVWNFLLALLEIMGLMYVLCLQRTPNSVIFRAEAFLPAFGFSLQIDQLTWYLIHVFMVFDWMVNWKLNGAKSLLNKLHVVNGFMIRFLWWCCHRFKVEAFYH